MSKKIKNIKIVNAGSPPDIDSDFQTNSREHIFKYLKDTYGEDNVAHLITPGPFKAKNAWKSSANVYGISNELANSVSALIPDTNDKDIIDDLLDESNPQGADYRKLLATNPKLKEAAIKGNLLMGRQKETGVHACFGANTLVRTINGLKAISDIQVGELVLTHNNRYRPVTNVMSRRVTNGATLHTQNSIPTVTTMDHPFLVKSIIREKHIRCLTDASWMPVSELKHNEQVVGCLYPFNHIQHDGIMVGEKYYTDPDFFWVLGRFLGDGWASDFTTTRNKKRKDGTVYQRVDVVQTVTISVGYQDNTLPELEQKLGRFFTYYKENRETAIKLQLTGVKKDMFALFKSFGYKAHNKFVPNQILELNNNLLKAFIYGYLSADGSTKDGITLNFNTVSPKLALTMATAINKAFNSHVGSGYEKRDKMVIEGRTVQCRGRICMGFSTEGFNRKGLQCFADEKLWVQIRSITPIQDEITVYNLTVEEDHSYTVNNLICHNCGGVLANVPLTDVIPTMVRQDDGAIITQWNYEACESLGLLKMDFLGLNTLDLQQLTLQHIQKNYGITIDTEELINGPLDDKKTLELFQKGDTFGIFQFSEEGVRQLLREVKPSQFEELAAVTALYRPGPMGLGLHTDYAKRKFDPSARVPVHEKFYGTEVENILQKDYNALIYQESVMKIAQNCAGFTSEETDKLRKAMGKKKVDILNKMKPAFIEGMLKNGYDAEAVNVLWEGLISFGEYAFNRSHSISYALNSYISGYLKAHFPTEFMAATLQQKFGDEKIAEYLEETNRLGIRLTAPDINESTLLFTPTKNRTITYGLSCIKGLNEGVMDKILHEREANGKYTSIENFVERNKEHITKKVIEVFASIGCFDSFGQTRKSIYENAQILLNQAEKKKKSSGNLFSMFGQDVFSVQYTNEEWPQHIICQKEGEATGMFLGKNPIHLLTDITGNELKQESFNQLKIKTITKQYITILQTTRKTTKSGKKFLILTLDNGTEQIKVRADDTITKKLTLAKALAKTNNNREEAYKLLRLTEEEKVFYDMITPLDKIELFTVYQAKIERKNKDRVVVLDIEPVNLSAQSKVLKTVYYNTDLPLASILPKLEEIRKEGSQKTKYSDDILLYNNEGECIEILNFPVSPELFENYYGTFSTVPFYTNK